MDLVVFNPNYLCMVSLPEEVAAQIPVAPIASDEYNNPRA